MSLVTSNGKASLKRTYEKTLLSLLNSDEPEIGSDSDSCCDSETKLFQKDLEKLLIEGDFALELLQQVSSEDTAHLNWHRNDPPESGFHKLMVECYKFLNRYCKMCFLSSDGDCKQSHLISPKNPIEVDADHLTNSLCLQDIYQQRECIEKCQRTSRDDQVEFGHTLDVTRSLNEGDDRVRGDERKSIDLDLLQASKCLAGLITLTESQSFEALLSSVCFKRNRQTNRSLGLLILESILATNGIQDETDLRNLRLAFGETPLLLAIRARDTDVVLTLLRHGADVSRGWMGLENALEVLLFSPNQVFLEAHDISAVERCLEYLLRVMSAVNLEALAAKEKDGYYPLLPDWRSAVSLAMEVSWRTDSVPVPSLMHLCRCVVRKPMGHRLPDGLHSLPLPTLIRQFLRI